MNSFLGLGAVYFGLRSFGKFIGVTSPDAFAYACIFCFILAGFLGLALVFYLGGRS